MSKKWADPIDRLLAADEKARPKLEPISTALLRNKDLATYNQKENTKSEDNFFQTRIIEVDPKQIIRWKYKDRPENELGDIEDLADTFKTIGQQQPCILRLSNESHGKYELIVGERRWRAAEMAGLKVKAIVSAIDDKTSALIQAIENEKRNDLSDFAKGISFSDKIERGLITPKDIIEILGINKQQVTRLLSYRKIPKNLFDAIDDFRKVSSRTAYELVRLSGKSEAHLQALINMANKIRTGEYGQKKIERELERVTSDSKAILTTNKKIVSHDGRHLFTWRLDGNLVPSIHFPKEILDLMNENTINVDAVTEAIKLCIEQKINGSCTMEENK